jgi:hypothetical protein
MAKVGKNVLTRGLSGKLGNLVVFRNKGTKTIVSMAPGHREVPQTTAQNLHHQKFREAVMYAKSVLADPGMKQKYQSAAKDGETAFNVAVADFIKLPVIEEIDPAAYTGQPGEKIRIRATDSFMVKQVSVGIYQSDGSRVESGEAESNGNGLDWFYITNKQNPELAGGKIVAAVTDHPGHKVEMTRLL